MKNAPKHNLVKNPTVGIGTHVLLEEQGMNKPKTAHKMSLTFLTGEPETKTADIKGSDGKVKKVSWTVLGTVDLSGTFTAPCGTECRLVAVKRFGRISALEIRAVSGETAEGGTSVEL
jgi:hypothetical protein